MTTKNSIHKKLRFYSAWDIKSIFIGLIIILGISGLFVFMIFRPSGDSREKDKDIYNLETKGMIYSIIKKNGSYQGRTGFHDITLGYELNYSYEVNGQRYKNVDFVQGSSAEEFKFINFAYNHLYKDTFIVRYCSWKPGNSFLIKRFDELIK